MDIRIPADFEPHAHTIMAPAVHRELGADREGDGADHAVADDEPQAGVGALHLAHTVGRGEPLQVGAADVLGQFVEQHVAAVGEGAQARRREHGQQPTR